MKQDVMMKKIRLKRKGLDLSMGQMAEILGICKSSYYKIEHGEMLPRKAMSKIITFLDLQDQEIRLIMKNTSPIETK